MWILHLTIISVVNYAAYTQSLFCLCYWACRLKLDASLLILFQFICYASAAKQQSSRVVQLHSSRWQWAAPLQGRWYNDGNNTNSAVAIVRVYQIDSSNSEGKFTNERKTVVRHISGQNLTTVLWPIHWTFSDCRRTKFKTNFRITFYLS